jgi:hypothetical protein
MPGLTIFNEERAQRLARLKEEIQQEVESGLSEPLNTKVVTAEARARPKKGKP